MRVVVQCLLLVCCALPLASHAHADDVIIGSPLTEGKMPAGDGSKNVPIANPRSGFEQGSVLDNFATSMQSAGQAAGGKADFLVKVDAAREEFFNLYPDKPGVEEARTKLADLLAQIDLYYLTLYLPAGMSDAEIPPGRSPRPLHRRCLRSRTKAFCPECICPLGGRSPRSDGSRPARSHVRQGQRHDGRTDSRCPTGWHRGVF